jgi:hypothetical protein
MKDAERRRRTEAAMNRQQRGAAERIVAEIRRHLAAHPDARDTAAGIMHWWLHEEPGAAGSLDDVERALERLEANGEVERVAAPGGGVVYRARG